MTGDTSSPGGGDEPSEEGATGTTEATPTVTGSPQPFTPTNCYDELFFEDELSFAIRKIKGGLPEIYIKGDLLAYYEREHDQAFGALGLVQVVDPEYPTKPLVEEGTTFGCFLLSFRSSVGRRLRLRTKPISRGVDLFPQCDYDAFLDFTIPKESDHTELLPCSFPFTSFDGLGDRLPLPPRGE